MAGRPRRDDGRTPVTVMKNFLILALTALLLFSISAALSLWLNQSRYAAETSPSTEKSTKKTSTEKDKEGSEPHSQKKESGMETGLGGVNPESLARAREKERRLNLREDEITLILNDILAQRDVIDALIKQVLAELKSAENKVGDLENRAVELEKKRVDFEAAERKNIERIAGLLDAMAPESSAATLKQMADSGRLEVAAKVLALMKERNAARALGELSDPALAAQLLDKMRLLKSASVSPTTPPGGVFPSSGVPAAKAPLP
jgi:hypothetical protein